MPSTTLTHSQMVKLKKVSPANESISRLNPQEASRAVADALEYLKKRLGWSGTKIANILHIPSNTLNTWLQKGSVPIDSSILQPNIQAIIHLLAIHRSLEAMFENPEHQSSWLSTIHPELNIIPEKLMGESIEGLIFIRQYLDYIRGKGA